MKSAKPANGKRKPTSFDAEAFLNSAGVARTIAEFREKSGAVLSGRSVQEHHVHSKRRSENLRRLQDRQGSRGGNVRGRATLSARGDLAGQPLRMATATAITPVTALVIENREMFRVLHAETHFPIASSPTCFIATSGSKRT